ncbi:unnamed protein product [Vitrella brassicaformis CCMP3155]|uniref:Protein kinase domain-containing protein n=1 Tax=Vitrella brassicaformis (strain CCMP3155) TaxID=1169540 RepID=A0A0G4H6A9_VITBC|nr:unnamed protein product [Vitrella brassicaformis CCMP3155]|eukprot:CEM39396.1 unnamed protein product [Vitrella brassicaformis CCMP3155]
MSIRYSPPKDLSEEQRVPLAHLFLDHVSHASKGRFVRATHRDGTPTDLHWGFHGFTTSLWDLQDQTIVVLKVPFKYEEEREPDAYGFPRNGMDVSLEGEVDHPAIVKVVGIYRLTGLPGCDATCGLKGYIMKACIGGDLMDLPRWTEVSEALVMPILKDVLDGLKFLHDIGVAHGDVIPQNVCLRRGADWCAHGCLVDIDRLFRFRDDPQWADQPRKDLHRLGNTIQQHVLKDKEVSPEAHRLFDHLQGSTDHAPPGVEGALDLFDKWAAVHGPGVRARLTGNERPPQHLVNAYQAGWQWRHQQVRAIHPMSPQAAPAPAVQPNVANASHQSPHNRHPHAPSLPPTDPLLLQKALSNPCPQKALVVRGVFPGGESTWRWNYSLRQWEWWEWEAPTGLWLVRTSTQDTGMWFKSVGDCLKSWFCCRCCSRRDVGRPGLPGLHAEAAAAVAAA